MWMRKLSDGVLRIVTPLGPRFIQLSFSQRLYLLWIFRHFDKLPLQVLSNRQQEWIDALCAQQKFLSVSPTEDLQNAPVLGTVERRPRIDVEPLPLPPRRPNARVTDAVARTVSSMQQRS
jgi:hypothetical protein